MWLLALLACDPNKDGMDTAELAWGDLDADGYALADGDCNDHNPAVYPSAEEACDFLDNDCDELIDEGNQKLWYLDVDSDGYGDPETEVESCTEVSGYIPTGRDCNDDDPSINPSVEEVCDGRDQNCDEEVDEGVTSNFWADVDGDGYGDVDVLLAACEQPENYVTNDFDCNDGDAEIHPAAPDICNLEDDDCDDVVDEDPDLQFWPDDDGDGFGSDGTPVAACTAPSGYAEGTEDCDDEDATLNPDSVWYEDADGDGHGGSAVSVEGCETPSGYVASGEDCDDDAVAVNPDATELCNDVDDDCDGDTDEDDAADALTWYIDADSDGYGVSTTTTVACEQPSGYAGVDGDCDESDSAISPGAVEECGNSVDDDCDGDSDETCAEDHCGAISSDETWTADQPHTVSCDLTVTAELTWEDGVTIEVDEGYGITVSAGGALMVEGTSTGVSITTSEGSPKSGDWQGITLDSADDSVLEGLTLEYAGGNGVGGLVLVGAELELTDSVVQNNDYAGISVENGGLTMTGTEVNDNETWGVYLDSDSTLDDAFTDNLVTGNDQPLYLHPDELGDLDSSTDLTGNDDDIVEVPGGYVTDDATWSDCGAVYNVTENLHIDDSTEPEVTIEDGTEFTFDPKKELRVGVSYGGLLEIAGTSTGVSFGSSETNANAGDWVGIYVGTKDTGSSFDGLSISNAGYSSGTQSCIKAYSELSITNSTLTDCAGNGIYVRDGDLALESTTIDGATSYGVYLYTNTGFSSFSANTITGGGGFPMYIGPNDLIDLDTASSFSGNSTDRIRVSAGSAKEDGTWPAYDYQVVSTLNIGDASLRPDITVSDGANFYFEGGQFRVGPSSYGVVTIEATTTGVTFSSAQTNPAAGDWGGLYFGGDADDSILEGVTVEYAGSGAASVYITQTKNLTFSDCTIENGGAAGLYGTGSADMSITDCSISDHASYGLRIDNAELNADFTNNTVSGNGEEPLYIHPEYLRYLDSTSTFTGNTTDAILVDGGTVSTSGTWPLLDVDYNVVGDVTVNATGAPHIVVEDGTTWSFDSTASLRVHLASIEAVGTSTSGITLTSSDAAPAAGDWQGLVLGGNCTPSKVQLDYVTVAYAGGTASGNSDTAIYWACDGGTISNSTISDSGGWGIYRWYATPTITSVSYSNTTSGDLY